MFGFFKPKLSTHELMLLAIRAAVVCRQTETQNGGLMTEPTAIAARMVEAARSDDKSLSAKELEIGATWVMRFLMEGTFITQLTKRAMQGSIGTFTAQDERDIERIIPEAFGR